MTQPPSQKPPFTILEEEEEEGPAPWVITFADMITLLMAFFALLYTVSQTDQKGFEHVATSVQNALGGPHSPGGFAGIMRDGGSLGNKAMAPKSLDELTGIEQESLFQDVRREFKGSAPEDQLQVLMRGQQVILQMGGQLLFGSGSATMSDQAHGVLDHVVRLLRNYPEYRVDIKGHTDSRPISTAKFDSNWELSSLRSTAVLRYLIERGISPSRLTATGYGDTQPLAPNTSEESMAKNRRVEFVLEKKEK